MAAPHWLCRGWKVSAKLRQPSLLHNGWLTSMCRSACTARFLPGEADDIIPKGNLGNVMKSLGKQNPNFSVKPLDQLTPTMQPLEKVKNKVNLITGMDRTFQQGTDVHAQCASCYLSSAEPYTIKGTAWPLNRTLDHPRRRSRWNDNSVPNTRVQLQQP